MKRHVVRLNWDPLSEGIAVGKFFLFYLLWRITGNPILAILVILVIYYFLDRRYIGLLPNLMSPIRRQMRLSSLRKQLSINPHDSPAKMDLIQILIERSQFRKALELLEQLPVSMQDLPDVLYDKGLSQMNLGRLEVGEQLTLQALSQNSSLRYGEPYLKLATAFANTDPEKSITYLKKYQAINYSSCESEYRMGEILKRLGQPNDAKAAWKQCIRTYRSLPKFRKRTERRWALLAWFRSM